MDNLCAHLRGLCSGKVPTTDRTLKRFIGKLNSISELSSYVEMCKELAHILISRESDQFDKMFIDMAEHPHWPHEGHSEGLVLSTYSGDKVRVYRRYKEPFINALISMDPQLPETHKVWSGLMKLQTARDGTEPSRSERDQIYKSISHRPSQSLESVWSDRGFTKVVERILIPLVKQGTPGRSYLPLFACPPTEKCSFLIGESVIGHGRPRTDMRHYIPNNALRVPEIMELYETDPEEFIAAGFTGCNIPGSYIIFDDKPMFPRGKTLGNITSINERGNKHRVVASPNLLINILGYPLARSITELNRRWPCQGFDSHKLTVEFIQRLLAQSWEGENPKTFHSIDMKSFTDYLPYGGFQSHILDVMIDFGLITQFDKKVMDLICSMPFRFLGTSLSVTYGTGTPMGSYPSFPLATFANGVMLAAASLECGYTNTMDLPGKVIGDDIVIWNDDVAACYRDIAKDLGLIISEDKSISSQHMCEMCSKIILPCGYFEKKKLKETISPGALLKDIEYYGLEFIQNLNESYRYLTSYLKLVPKPSGIGRELEEVLSDLELCSQIQIDAKLLVTPYEMYFLLSHLENVIQRYIDTPLDRESVHLMRLRLKYYPDIVPGPSPKDQFRDEHHYYDARYFLRHYILRDLQRLRGLRGNPEYVDGLKTFPSLSQQASLVNLARDIEFLDALKGRTGIKPMQVPRDYGWEAEPDDSVHGEPFKHYEDNDEGGMHL